MATATYPVILAQIEKTLAQWREHKNAVLPTALHFYRMGRLMHSLGSSSHRYSSTTTTIAPLRAAVHETVKSLPEIYRIQVFKDLKEAMLSLVASEQNTDEALEAMQALTQLYLSSPLAVESTSWQTEPDLQTLITFYMQEKSQKRAAPAVIAVIGHWLWTKTNLAWEDLLPALHLLQDTDVATTDLWKDFMDWTIDHNPGWRSILAERYPDDKDYLFSLFSVEEDNIAAEMRQAFADNDADHASKSNNNKSTSTTAATTASQELQRRINHIRQVLPDLGEGFIEICLSFFKGDVEQTVAALVDDGSQLPAQLRHLDRSLPRLRRDGPASLKEDYLESSSSNDRMVAKATLQAAQRQEEQEAFLIDRVMRQGAHDEYNDDYDDQYDDTEGFGAKDSGLYDSYEAVKTYNKAMKQVEEEQSFWEENRNMNRTQQPKKGKGGGEKTYRGPDKMRGGRVPQFGRGRQGGGRGSDNKGKANQDDRADDSSEQSREQGGRGGRGRGGRGGRGRGGRGGRGRGRSPAPDQVGGNNEEEKQKGNQKSKARKMANRRERQKKALAKRTG